MSNTEPSVTESSEQEFVNPAHQGKVDAARVEFGKVLAVVVEGDLLIFRKPKRAELVNMNKAARKQPEMAIEHAIGLCRVCHVGPGPRGIDSGDVDKWANEYALLFAGSDTFKGISDYLIEMSQSDAKLVLR